MNCLDEKQKNIFDLIIILDESGSMNCMESEPIQSVNIYIKDFKKEVYDSQCKTETTFTFVTFNSTIKYHSIDKSIIDVDEIPEDIYKPYGGTSLNDAICCTIKKTLECSKKNNKIMVIITDGYENSSVLFNKEDTKNMRELVKTEYKWEVIFIGSDINSFKYWENVNYNSQQIVKFDQNYQGDLLEVSRTTSSSVVEFTRARTEGFVEKPLKILKRSSTELLDSNIFLSLPSPSPLSRDSDIKIKYQCNTILTRPLCMSREFTNM